MSTAGENHYRFRAKREELKIFQGLSLGKWLKPRPESGLDRLMYVPSFRVLALCLEFYRPCLDEHGERGALIQRIRDRTPYGCLALFREHLVSGFRFQVSGFRSQVSGFRFQVSGFGFRV